MSRSWTGPPLTGHPATSPRTTGGIERSTTWSFEKSTRRWPSTTALSVAPVRASGSDVDDAASLLWRLHLFGVDVGDRAGSLVEDVEELFGEPVVRLQ